MSVLSRLLVFGFPFFYGLLAMAMGQDANWDLRNYHWYNAYAFLNGRFGFDLFPSQTPYFYNPLLDLPFYLLASHSSALTASFALGFVQGLNFILLFILARRLCTPLANRDFYAFLIALAGMMGGGVLGEMGTTFYDNIVSLGVLGTLNILVLRLAQAEDRPDHTVRWWKWVLAGIPVGLVSGLKLPTTVFAVGIGLAFFLRAAPWPVRLKRSALLAGGMVFGFLLGLGPWAYYLFSEFQNPLFPYFNDVFSSPLAPLQSARDVKFLASGWEKIYFPFLFTIDPLQVGEVPWRDLKIPLVYILLPPALLAALVLRVQGRLAAYNSLNDMTNNRRPFVLWAGVFSYVVWMLMFGIYRYAIPLEMLAGLMLFLAIDLCKLNAYNKKIIFFGLLVICFTATQPANWGRVPHGETFISVTGAVVPDPQNSMILMAGFQPYSHVLPAFDGRIPVVRVQSNFASPEEDKGINALIRQRVADHQGSLWLLIPTYDTDWVAQKTLPHFGLKTMLDQCRLVTNTIGEDLNLCPLNRQ